MKMIDEEIYRSFDGVRGDTHVHRCFLLLIQEWAQQAGLCLLGHGVRHPRSLHYWRQSDPAYWPGHGFAAYFQKETFFPLSSDQLRLNKKTRATEERDMQNRL